MVLTPIRRNHMAKKMKHETNTGAILQGFKGLMLKDLRNIEYLKLSELW